jgi:acyl carrier protein
VSGPAVAQVRDAVSRTIREFVPELAEEFPPEASLEELGVDSMTVVDVVLKMQDEFRVELPDDVLARIDTVADLADVLQALIDARAFGGEPPDPAPGP